LTFNGLKKRTTVCANVRTYGSVGALGKQLPSATRSNRLTVKEAAKLLRVSTRTIHRYIKERLLNAVRLKHAYRIADNRVTQETDWDKWKLRSEFNELFSDGDYFTGFTQEEVSDIMAMDLGFRNDREMDAEMPSRIYPREIACDEEQDAVFDRVQTLMGKKKDVDVVMELCEMFLTMRSE